MSNTDTDRALALALADCLDNPVASDGTFLGLTDSALAAKALRLFATGQAVGCDAPTPACSPSRAWGSNTIH